MSELHVIFYLVTYELPHDRTRKRVWKPSGWRMTTKDNYLVISLSFSLRQEELGRHDGDVAQR